MRAQASLDELLEQKTGDQDRQACEETVPFALVAEWNGHCRLQSQRSQDNLRSIETEANADSSSAQFDLGVRYDLGIGGCQASIKHAL